MAPVMAYGQCDEVRAVTALHERLDLREHGRRTGRGDTRGTDRTAPDRPAARHALDGSAIAADDKAAIAITSRRRWNRPQATASEAVMEVTHHATMPRTEAVSPRTDPSRLSV